MKENRVYKLLYTIIYPFFLLLYPIKVIGRENIPDGPAVICPNHTRAIDPFFVVFAFRRKNIMRIMAKIELIRIPVLGWLLRHAGIFGVDRGAADIGAVKTALRHLKEGRKLLLFPEGTRVSEGESVEAKTGAAMFATRTGSPLLPVYITPHKRMFRRNLVVIGQPFEPKFEGRKCTAEELRAVADELMARIYALGEEQQ
ncbi:MAG: 1-acyl-sn-glycerol-3-phosphate acyltransferase [Ruminococcaceae bacterium]|nr:1-acyl-sn-glycerol-3-phosphate acyltransferase [Oscillospiraceae bacterium]